MMQRTPRDIEFIALDVLGMNNEHLIDNKTPALKRIVEKEGFSISSAKFREDKLLAAFLRAEREISIKEDMPFEFKNFLVARYLWYILFDKDVLKELFYRDKMFHLFNQETNSEKDMQANLFAGYILAPKYKVLKCVGEHRWGSAQFVDIDIVSTEFAIPAQVAAMRLNQIGPI